MKAIETHAIFTSFGSRADGSLSFRGMTPELTTNEKVALMDLHQKNVKILIQPLDEVPDEILNVKKVLDFKTPSQRLRSIMFLEWKAQKPDCSFDDFYQTEMNRLIEKKKERLDAKH